MRSNTNFIEKDFNENDNKVWKSISEHNQEKCISGRDQTDLFKQGVKFLNGSILSTTYLKIKKNENITEWLIRFFVGSPHERCLCICVDNSMSGTGNTKGDNANKKSTHSYSSAKQASAKVFSEIPLEKRTMNFPSIYVDQKHTNCLMLQNTQKVFL